MRWADDAPARFTVRYEWPNGTPRDACKAQILLADTVEDAKLEAAILFACIDVPNLPPAYRILKGARRVVYRYPGAASGSRRAA